MAINEDGKNAIEIAKLALAKMTPEEKKNKLFMRAYIEAIDELNVPIDKKVLEAYKEYYRVGEK